MLLFNFGGELPNQKNREASNKFSASPANTPRYLLNNILLTNICLVLFKFDVRIFV